MARNRPRATVTLKSLAEMLEIDVSTVSRVLNGDQSRVREAASESTIKRIQDLATKLDYRPNPHALHLKLQQSREIGVLMPRLSDLVMATVYDGIDAAAREAGYTSFVINTLDDPEQQLARAKQALQMRVAGLIISDTHIGSKQPLLKLLKEQNVPYVLVYRRHANHLAVTGNDRQGGALAAEHLYEKGHRKVGVLAGYEFARSSLDRTHGFLDYFAKQGVEVPDSAIIYGNIDPQSGRQHGHALLNRHPDITGVFAINDFLAIGCMGYFRDSGKVVGGDVAVVGYNDTSIAAELPVALTSVRVPMENVGRLAALKLLDRINGREVQSEFIDAELRVRASSDFRVSL